MITRRGFVLCAAPAVLRGAAMTSKQRVDALVSGAVPDRTPFTIWHHFGLQDKPPAEHARATLKFQADLRLDLVKVMSDFPYPKGAGKAWYELKPLADPYPAQIAALRLIRDGLKGQKNYVETIFNPYNVAEKLSSKDEVKRLMTERPQALLAALEAIAKSEAAHAKKSVAEGAAGVFLAIANAQTGLMTRPEYKKFSEPFDRMVLDAVKGAPLNILHLHGDKVYLDLFWKGWDVAAINYSRHETGVRIAEARKQYSGVLMAGFDQRLGRTASEAQWKAMAAEARKEAGAGWLAAPGCSVPDDSTTEELLRLTRVLGG